ncbi:MAG: ATP phosphoribosyltransferase regulatory subunit [Pseudomonadota bacterium]
MSTLRAEVEAKLRARFGALSDVPLLQPLDAFLDTAGEGFRSRLFVTTGEGSEELCLRPEFTIPLCLAHDGTQPTSYAYCGDVFRRGREGHAQHVQAGAEMLGAGPEADVEALTAALDLLPAEGVKADLVLGDQDLFEALLVALDVTPSLRPRLLKAFGHPGQLAKLLDRAMEGRELAALSPELQVLARAGNVSALAQELEATMRDHGLPLTGGREAQHIAERLVGLATTFAEPMAARTRAVIDAYLSLSASYGQIESTLRAFEAEHGVGFGAVLDRFDGLLRSLDTGLNARFEAGFGRPLDYYSGLVFEVRPSAGGAPAIFGGRYDGLLRSLGATDAPAIGFAAALDRLEALVGEEGAA